MNYHFVMVSGNAKTGPIPVSMTSKDSCPNVCPFKKNGCYAATGRLNIHWNRLYSNGLSLNEFTKAIASIPVGRMWRHNQAGDIAKDSNGAIDSRALKAITKANKGRKGFTYTHCDPRFKSNAKAIADANKNGFTVNLSANNLNHADDLKSLGIAPVVVVLPSDQKKNTITPKGNKVVICPNYTHGVQCMDCGLWQVSQRSVIVGFPAHGIAVKRVNAVVSKNN